MAFGPFRLIVVTGVVPPPVRTLTFKFIYDIDNLSSFSFLDNKIYQSLGTWIIGS